MQIVLARLDECHEIERYGRTDLGEPHKFKVMHVPVACMWLSHGTESDATKAAAFARTEGYTVFCYNDEKDPLGRARREIKAGK